ncbi:MAG: Holliday junction resolvase RuvX [Candidatus Omnitrophica bacterium]|nr:Holliday junction resolvase RuvX [Candidatus Omnitrophota bacterium]
MGVLVGLDLGEKRVGVARSDETGTIAEAYATLTFKTKDDLLRQLKECLEELGPEKVVVGLPETLSGERGFAAKKVLAMVDWLKESLSMEWVLWDERFTTVEAEAILLEADLSRKKRRGIRDRLAAQRILQSYLDTRKNA